MDEEWMTPWTSGIPVSEPTDYAWNDPALATAPAIVFGADYAPGSDQAFEEAVRTAKKWKAHLVLLHAIRPLGAPGLDLEHPAFDKVRNETADVPNPTPGESDSAMPIEATQPGVQGLDYLARAKSAGVHAELVSLPGHPVEVILQEARRRHARAIVVGTHGRKGLKKAILGSVAQALLERSPVPVVVVPGSSAA